MAHALADPRFAADMAHWLPTSSQIPACVLEVGSVADTAAAVDMLSSAGSQYL